MKDKEIEIKPAENNTNKNTEKNSAYPTQLHTPLPEKEAQHVMSKTTDICAIYQSMLNLPDSSEIEKDSNFYIDELLRILADHGIITL